MSDIRSKMERLLQGDGDDLVRAVRQPGIRSNRDYPTMIRDLRAAIEHYFDPVYEIADACRGRGVMIPGSTGMGELFPNSEQLRSAAENSRVPRVVIELTPSHLLAVTVAATTDVIHSMHDLEGAKLRCRLVERHGAGRSYNETDLTNTLIHNVDQLMEWFCVTTAFAAELQATANELNPNDVRTYWDRRSGRTETFKTPPQLPEAVAREDEPPGLPVERDRVITLRGALTEESSDVSSDQET